MRLILLLSLRRLLQQEYGMLDPMDQVLYRLGQVFEAWYNKTTQNSCTWPVVTTTTKSFTSDETRT